MINKIFFNENKTSPNFKSNFHYKTVTKNKTAIISGNSATQIKYLKKIIQELLAKIENNQELIKTILQKTKVKNLDSNSLSFLIDERSELTFLIPKDKNKDLFEIKKS